MADHIANGSTKQLVQVSPTGKAVVVKSVPGTVGLLDKLKAYYHTIIILLTGAVSVLAVIGKFTNFIPGPVAGYVIIASTVVGAVLTALKSNEQWVDSL